MGRINGRFSHAGWVPIHYHFYGFPQHELVDYYLAWWIGEHLGALRARMP